VGKLENEVVSEDARMVMHERLVADNASVASRSINALLTTRRYDVH